MTDAPRAITANYPRRWLAVLLSIPWPGLGLAYLGRWRISLAVFAVVLGSWGVVVAAALEDRLTFGILIACFALHLATWLGAILATFVLSRRAGSARRPAYSRWYGLLAIAGLWHLAWFFTPVPIESFYIPAASMVPALAPGDRFMSVHWDRVGRLPLRGEIIVARVPSLGADFVKRVIGLPGDRVQLQDNVVIVNGQKLPQRPLDRYVYAGSDNRSVMADQFEERSPDGIVYRILIDRHGGPNASTSVYIVPPGHFFVLGDNRNNSLDSRFPDVGTVPVENLRAKPLFLYYSPRFSRIGNELR